MSLRRVLGLFKRGESPSVSPNTFATEENMPLQDTTSLEEQQYERAKQELSVSQTELARLKAEYVALGEKVRRAEVRFQLALQALYSLKRSGGY